MCANTPAMVTSLIRGCVRVAEKGWVITAAPLGVVAGVWSAATAGIAALRVPRASPRMRARPRTYRPVTVEALAPLERSRTTIAVNARP